MKNMFLKTLIVAAVAGVSGLLFYNFKFRQYNYNPTTVTPVKSFFDLSIKSIDGKELKFADLKGKKVLCVNVASQCGYTPQYSELQKLQDKYKDKLVIIGFPCNQFGAQEPGDAEEIQTFCKKNYGVTFQLTQKIDVKGKDQHPIYQWLTQKAQNGKSDYEVKWNFNKFLINEKGELVQYFPSGVKPFDTNLTTLIDQ
jgi:glutathione peroxidase